MKVNERSIAQLALVPDEIRHSRAVKGGHARKAALSPERLREIAMMGVAARLAKVPPERQREISRLGAQATNRKRWGTP